MIIRHFVELLKGKTYLLFRFLFSSVGRSISMALIIVMLQEFLTMMSGKETRLSAMVGHGPYAKPLTVLLLVLTYFLGTALNYDNRVVQQRGSQELELGLMNRLVRHLMSLGVGYISKESPGDMIQTMRQDVVNYRLMIFSVSTFFVEAVSVICLSWVLLTVSPALTFWTLLILIGGSIPTVLITHKRMQYVSKAAHTAGYVLLDGILQILIGIRIIKAYGMEDREARSLSDHGENFFSAYAEVVRLGALARIVGESFGLLCLVVIIVVGGFQVNVGKLSWTALITFVMASRALMGPMYSLYFASQEINLYLPSVRRIFEVLDTEPKVREHPNPITLSSPPSRITFEDVSFSYDGQSPTLRHLTFDVGQGETVGLVGPSGSGKSTVLNLLMRFYDPSEGRILIDGIDLRELRLSEFYSQIAVVAQEPFLFATSVRENIRCGRPQATNEEVEAAARATDIHEEILSFPQGYDTLIGIGGKELSRGQAQRINVARALLRRAPILILDEATSSLDSISEAQVQRSIEQLVQGKTSLVVAHRLSTLRDADRLIVLEDGVCAGIGTHSDMLENCAFYRNASEMQHV